ncbi:hypothetical protein, partial [Metapseudomonas otitidis]|uniref:hypothetical protein n=1 Tax=Metapseudomonas otitidis TaxID=319939 RepID=UPI00197F9E7F
VMGGLATGDDLVAWPESSKINRMHGGSRGWGLVRLVTANLPTSLTVNSLFPLIPRRTKNIALILRWHYPKKVVIACSRLQSASAQKASR